MGSAGGVPAGRRPRPEYPRRTGRSGSKLQQRTCRVDPSHLLAIRRPSRRPNGVASRRLANSRANGCRRTAAPHRNPPPARARRRRVARRRELSILLAGVRTRSLQRESRPHRRLEQLRAEERLLVKHHASAPSEHAVRGLMHCYPGPISEVRFDRYGLEREVAENSHADPKPLLSLALVVSPAPDR